MEITNGEVRMELPDTLAKLLIENRGWEKTGSRKRATAPAVDADEGVAECNTDDVEDTADTEDEAEGTDRAEGVAECNTDEADEPNPEAACDDDLPDGIVFADSAYDVVIDKETGEEIRVLKTHCRNGHEYAGNVKIRVRGNKAYRECQTCLSGRKARAAAKRAESRK